jgi:hypothetical protein
MQTLPVTLDQTPQAQWALIEAARAERAFYRQSPETYSLARAVARTYAVGGAIYGLPDKPDAPEVTEPDRPGSRLTAPNATDTSVKLAQFVRISGMRGVAVLNRFDTSAVRHLTATGRHCHTRKEDPRGMPPTYRGNVMPDDDEPRDDGIRQSRRYRESMRGAKFAKSLADERVARHTLTLRNALPYWPFDAKHGRFIDGVRIGSERHFPDGTTLSQRVEWHSKAEAEAIAEASQRMAREVELARLVAEQDADLKAQRKGRMV